MKPKPLNRRSLKFRTWLEKNCREIVRRKRLGKYIWGLSDAD